MQHPLRSVIRAFGELVLAATLALALSGCAREDAEHDAEVSTQRLDRALAELLDALDERDSPVLPLLAEGRSPETVRERLAALGLECPAELPGYYRWRDGLVADRQTDPELFPGAHLLSLDEATGLHGQLTAMAAQISARSGVDAARIWDPRWFPVLAGVSSDFYVLVCDGAPEASPAIHHVVLEDPGSLRPVFDSLAAMVETAAAAYAAGLYRMDEDGVLQEDKPAVAALVARLNPGVAGEAAQETGEAAAEGAVARALERGDDRARARALLELVDPADPGTAGAVVAVLEAREVSVRVGVTRVLMDMEDPRAEGVLLGLLDDDSWMVRSAAAQGLGQLGSTRAVPALTARLDDEEQGVRLKAAWALGEIGDGEAVPALLAVISDAHPPLRASTAQALGRIGDARALDALVRAMDDRFPQVRQLAAWGLGELGDPAAREVLEKALQDDDPAVASLARESLARIGEGG